MRVRILLAGLSVSTCLVTASVSSTATAQEVDGPQVIWNTSLWGAKREFTTVIEAISEYVREKTGGKFDIRLHYGEALSTSRENLDGIKLGAFQVAMFCAGYHPGKNPSLMALELPFVFDDLDGSRRAHEAVFEHPQVKKEMAQWDVKLLAAAPFPAQNIFGKGDAPVGPESFSGMRVRATGPLGDFIAAMGGSPTSVPAADTFTALDLGTIDAAVYTMGSAFSFGLADIVKWYTGNLTIGATSCPIAVKQTAFDALPAQYQQVLEDSREFAYERNKEVWMASDADKAAKLEEKGVVKVIFSDEDMAEFREKGGSPVWQKWITENSANGIPAQEIFDTIMKASGPRS